jgi:hypothetical protein
MKRHAPNSEGLTIEEGIEHSCPRQHRSDFGRQELAADLVLWELRSFDNVYLRTFAQCRNGCQ